MELQISAVSKLQSGTEISMWYKTITKKVPKLQSGR